MFAGAEIGEQSSPAMTFTVLLHLSTTPFPDSAYALRKCIFTFQHKKKLSEQLAIENSVIVSQNLIRCPVIAKKLLQTAR
ncbi:hypothetical protein E2C01_022364 [Portunus trituberculatus]|uniref:Uncharacterized protein n=1 Tax=Portunus trituberculatus TaxID=210409 RepID=A0A5B7E731_PORTR|nr:hypothetical protein [Portunus trituberculatus]